MESAFVAVIALLVLLGGAVALLSRQRMLPWTLPPLRLTGGASAGPSADERAADAHEPGLQPISDGSPLAATQWSSGGAGALRAIANGHEAPDPVRLDVVPGLDDVFAARLDRIEDRLDELHRAIAKQSETLAAETHRARSELMLRAEADDARREAAVERLRADLVSALSRAAAERGNGAGARRQEVTAELYARVARLEAALSAVTNPILLPGEPYAPPAEFLPEALIWENWNEVGERVFALADAFSAERLHLSEETRADLGGFVTTLRTLLTRSIYPNLQPDLDRAQLAALRAALDQIATELPRVRGMLEVEYRQGPSD